MMQRKEKIKKILISGGVAICATSLSLGIFFSQDVLAESVQDKYTYANLWVGEEGIAITDNVDVPVYAQEGWRQTGYESGKMRGEYLTAEDLEPWQINGVKVSTSSESGIVWYSNVIDISGFTGDDHLLDIMPLATTRKISRDFSGLKIYVCDADNEDNWFTVNFRALDLTYYPGTLISVTTSTGFTGAYRWGDYEYNASKSEWETGHGGFYNVNGSSMEGIDSTEILFEPFSIRYDVESKDVKLSSGCIMNLQDTPAMGEGKEFSGFTNNRIRIGIQALGIESAPAEYMILNVANHGMNGAEIKDLEKPYHYDLYKNQELPIAMVGKEYKVLQSQFYDFYDGEIAYKVSYKKSTDETYMAIEGNSFTPQSAGIYSLKYEGVDCAGNLDAFTYDIIAKERVNIAPLQIEVDDTPIQAKLGTHVYLPQATVLGGSGTPILTKEVIRLSDDSTLDCSEGYFTPLFAGDYAVKYTAVDYIGEVFSVTVKCNVAVEYAPVFEQEMTMYDKVVDKIKIVLPTPTAYDYISTEGHRISAVTEITVKGTGEKSTYSQKLDDYTFTPDVSLFGTQAVIEYKVYCKQYPDYAQTRSYTVDIIKPQYSWDYLTYDDTLTLSYNQKEENSKYVSFTANAASDMSVIKVINPLRAEGVEFLFSVDTDKKNFNHIALELCDMENNTQKIELQIKEYTDKKSEVYYNGKLSYMSGGFATDTSLQLKYQNNAIVDYLGEKVFDLTDFEGFSSGKVWVSVKIVSPESGAQLKIKKIGVQQLGADYRSSGMTTFKDTIAPEIEVLEDISASADFNTTVAIPLAKAYDWCSGYVDVSVSLTAPNEEKIIDNQALTEGMSFKAMQYGVYTLIYQALDDAGRKTTVRYAIYVEDKSKPVIVYGGETSMQASVGEQLTFEPVNVYDNLDTELSVNVYVIESNGTFVNVSETLQHTFIMKGKHTLRYCAYDSNYNYSWIDVTIWVK